MQQTLCDIFWESATRNSTHVALVEEGRSYSYEDLKGLVAGLASVLVDAGVARGTTVAVCAQPSVQSIVSMLGVLCAGGVYVPIDPDTPTSRVNEMIADGQISFALGPNSLMAREAFRRLRTIDPIHDTVPTSTLRSAQVRASDLAYVFYTSGSSGRPKGVAVEHRSVANYIRSLGPVYEFAPGDKILPFVSIAFDWSIEELLLPLSVGATVVTPRDRRYQTPIELASALRDYSITALAIPPTHLDQLITVFGEQGANLPSLRLVITGGEELTPHVWARWEALGLRIPIINGYGPTEATIVTTYHVLLPGDEYADEVPIGRPIPNAQVYVLDESLFPVPDGEEGEIVIGGDGVARGYLGNPLSTAERFVPDPFSSTPGSRMYRTGDRGAYQSSALRFRGRLDNQVKLHGYRIELEEIEANLRMHPSVSEAVVVATADEPRRLVAYVTARHRDLMSRQLRLFLNSRLPYYMVPSYFVELDRLPRGINGKVDKSKLPGPDLRTRWDAAEYESPHTQYEETVADVFAEVLALEVVGRSDNFFELGGDSILSIQVVSRASQRGVHISLRDVYDHQTVAAIAAQVKSQRVPEERPRLVGPSTIPMTPSQAWFFEQNYEDPHRWTNDTRLWTAADEAIAEQALEYLARRHEALQVRFHSVGDDWVQYIPTASQSPVLRVVDTATLGPRDRETAIEKGITRLHDSINIIDGPLWNAGLFKTRGESLLVIAGHHLVMDGVSFLLLEDELDQLINSLEAGRPPSLAPVLSLSEWTHRLHRYAYSTELRHEYPHWHGSLACDVAPIPRDKPSDLDLEPRVEFVATQIRGEDATLFRDAVRASELRADALLLAALVISLDEWRPGPFRVFVEGHCRGAVFPDIDVSRTIGWIQCYYPVVLTAKPSSPWATARTIHSLLEETPGGGLGYGVLRHIGPNDASKTLSSLNPRREIAFNFEGYLPSGAVARSDMASYASPLLEYGADEGIVEMRGKDAPFLLVHAIATEQAVATQFTYDGRVYSQESMGHLAQQYLSALQCLSRSVPADLG